jgi:hypothetical protein
MMAMNSFKNTRLTRNIKLIKKAKVFCEFPHPIILYPFAS